MLYPDFVISKIVPKQHPGSHFKHCLAVLKIKNDSEALRHIKDGASIVMRALMQLAEYSEALMRMRHVRKSDDKHFSSYLLYIPASSLTLTAFIPGVVRSTIYGSIPAT